jgi:hypothetical protein
LSINSADISISRSKLLDLAVPVSKISSLSCVEFAGIVADNPDCQIELKTSHSEIINDHNSLQKEERSYEDITPIRKTDNIIVQRN